MKKVRYVLGKVDKPLELDPDEKVIFAGDCTRWQATINGKDVKIGDCYKSPTEVNERETHRMICYYKKHVKDGSFIFPQPINRK